MEDWTFFRVLVVLVSALVWIVPIWRILVRLGYRGEWALLALFPPSVLAAAWVVAFMKWPSDRADPSPSV